MVIFWIKRFVYFLSCRGEMEMFNSERKVRLSELNEDSPLFQPNNRLSFDFNLAKNNPVPAGSVNVPFQSFPLLR